MTTAQKPDRFSEIARQQASQRSALLVTPVPPDLPAEYLPWHDLERFEGVELPFQPINKKGSPGELRQELTRYRRRYARYLRDLAPPLELTRLLIPLESFDWRVETLEDCQNPFLPFSGQGEWTRVTIPHYGAPLGRARVFYRTNFSLVEETLAKGALFVHFKGVDYKAHVFVNSAYVGSHEGFFAPFEFDFSAFARTGENSLVVIVENDAICMGNESWGEDGHLYEGDKIYAATGPGWDDPVVGWHHCPPGMGIYQAVTIEARPTQFIQDLFIRPMIAEKRIEAWIEVFNNLKTRQPIRLELSVFGQNFRQSPQPVIQYLPPSPCGPGTNYYKVSIEINPMRLWTPETPWLYQVQARLSDLDDQLLDNRARQFGMRSFRMDETGEPKGMFYLNDQPIRLRGANTMGFEQQDVMKQDWDQLRDDILLAKICHMNFWRLTQRPVQEEIYEFCDRLGLMTQTDLPLFAVLRRNQFSEAARQAGEMERLVRSHPCNILVTYINEPFPDASAPFTTSVDSSRHLTRPELESFFQAANQAVLLANPDRVIKPVDGDYYPPAVGLPDNHCYCGWYNGHGVDLGRLHRGYWQPVKPGWFYGCGEFGAEGLDPVSVMRARYPAHWLPQSAEEEAGWTPDGILKAQTGMFHWIWFDTQHSVQDWVNASQQHQAWVTKLMAEAFRRDRNLVTMAIHLFIDAFPAGWMKAIMDVERTPKPAYFAYREALTPVMANLRTDRWAFWAGEQVALEVWLMNDHPFHYPDASLKYWLELDTKLIAAGEMPVQVAANSVDFKGFLRFIAPEAQSRTVMEIHLGLFDNNGQHLHDTQMSINIFPETVHGNGEYPCSIYTLNSESDRAGQYLADALEVQILAYPGALEKLSVIWVEKYDLFERHRQTILDAVEQGARLIFYQLPEGEYHIAGQKIRVLPCGMNPVHFVSRATTHPLVQGFQPDDFKFWYDEKAGYVTPILSTTFLADGWTPILSTGNGGWGQSWAPALAAAEIGYGRGLIQVCQLDLLNRLKTNPTAMHFAQRLMCNPRAE